MSQENTFYNLKERVIHDKIPFTVDEFKAKLLKHRPSTIWNYQWSSKMPIFEVSYGKEIEDDVILQVTCNALSKDSPNFVRTHTVASFYQSIKFDGGISSYSF